MADISDVFPVFQETQKAKQEIGQVVLNGYKIDNENPLGFSQGVIRSFKVISGDFWQSWDAQAPLIMQDEQAREHAIRILAMPVDSDSFGLVEFL